MAFNIGGAFSGAASGASAGSMAGPWGAAIGGVAGGLLGGFSGGGETDMDSLSQQFEWQKALQKEFAQNGVRWRVEDARAAGIHPAAALGMQPFQPGGGSMILGSRGDSDWLSRAGHDISTAIDRTRTQPEKIESRMEALTVERGELENELLRSQIARLNQGSGPPMPLGSRFGIDGGSSQGPLIVDKPLERVASGPDTPHAEPGSITDIGWARTRTGWVPVPSKDMKERIEDSPMESMWFLRNQGLPNVGGGSSMPPVSLARELGGIGWRYNRLRQEWEVVHDREPSSNGRKGSRIFRYSIDEGR